MELITAIDPIKFYLNPTTVTAHIID